MDQPTPPAKPNPNPSPRPNPNKKPTLCEECGSNPWKYRCPGCSIRSCSLPCVKSHKQRTGCTGKRSLADVVPLSEFDDNRLISDYNMLEEVKRLTDSSRRMREGIGGNFGYSLPRRLYLLFSAARRRKTRLRLMPIGMSKRENNKSRFSEKKMCIFWTIEWRFHSTDVILIDHNVNERVSLSTVIKKHLTPGPWNKKLRPYCNVQLHDLKFFLLKNQKDPKSPFRKLNVDAPIGKQLADTVILEYPVIHVYLPSHSFDFEVEEDVQSKQEPLVLSGSILSPPGPSFREEEIEEGEVVLDSGVLHHTSSAPRDGIRIPGDGMAMEKAGRLDVQVSRAAVEDLKPFSCGKRGAHVVEEGNRYSNSVVNSMKLSEDEAFDFEKELRDAYSDFIGEMNPDDFLCLDGGQDDADEELEKRSGNPLYFGEDFLQDEELEEGEIPN